MEWSTELMSQSWFQSLYEGATVTVCGAYCSIMQYAIRAKLSYKAIQELLVLLHIICPQSSKLPKTLFMLKKFFKAYSVPYTSSKVFSQCSTPCHGTSRNVNCPNCHSSSLISNLIHIPIEKSLQTISLVA